MKENSIVRFKLNSTDKVSKIFFAKAGSLHSNHIYCINIGAVLYR